ncbi:hypothetical protein PNK_1367 [Candidatus Protochlamydia naegleriophila]|uniref:F-box/LRR-repeat protein 15-like leucin rich repeat domain-containing protein n=1 Tax=Candidatus Protochlamydia naegleriophila TaxID=389348 RepID=A0A0U5JDX5_9BACT|nr:hypothetical protein [Candidatus Protochlamydia naegleriophila]CUI16980.1 hypothetical protein PNK_1367 [Candidatus Protochlamydia naegleriophila]
MQPPDFLSVDLKPYSAFSTDAELFQALSRQPADLIAFFETCCADEVWMRRHVPFVRLVLRWAAKSFYLNRLPIYYAKQFASIIRTYYSALKPFLFFQPALFSTFKLIVDSQARLVNSLLFGTSSPFFKDLFANCFNELRDQWAISSPMAVFEWIERYATRGTCDELWRCEYQELLDIMRQAKVWGFPGLVKECAQMLKKYVTRDNVVEMLLLAHKQIFFEWKKICCAIFNQQYDGMRLLESDSESDFRVEILDFKQDTLELFNRLAPFVTHLAFSENLSSNRYYGKLVDACPRLIGMDLSGSTEYDNQFDDLPGSLAELNLSACPWLRPAHIKEVGYQFLNLKKLYLDGNAQLDFQAWGELNRLRYLMALSLVRCHQLRDEDLKLIVRSCSHLLELDLEECRKLTDKGLSEVLITCPQLIKLNCSRCDELTDRTLVELGVRGHQLAQLELERCTQLTDEGLLQFVHLRTNLKTLNIKGCEFSLRTIERIRRDYPFLEIID